MKRDKPVIIESTPPQYSYKSKIEMGGDIIFTSFGDTAFQIPRDWVVEPSPENSSSIEVVCSNPDGTLYLVIKSEGVHGGDFSALQDEDIINVTNTVIEKRLQSGNAIKTKQSTVEKIADIKYATFRTSTTGGAIESRNMVLITPQKMIYTVSLIPVNDIMNRMPSPQEIDQLFKDLINTVML